MICLAHSQEHRNGGHELGPGSTARQRPNFCAGQCWYDVAIAVHPTMARTFVWSSAGSAFTNNSSTLFPLHGWRYNLDQRRRPTTSRLAQTSCPGPPRGPRTRLCVLRPMEPQPRLYTGDDGWCLGERTIPPGDPARFYWVGLEQYARSDSILSGHGRPSLRPENIIFGGNQDQWHA